MKTDITELVFILDRSGSMAGLESDTIGGYNAMLKKQMDEPGDAVVTTVLFDDNYELLHDRIDIRGIKPITGKDYYVGGSTALLDAVGRTILKIANVQAHTSEDRRAEKVIFVITTDGMENASREYSCPKVKAMVELQKEKYGWEFIFMGANMDAVSTAASFGIDADRATNCCPDSEGARLQYAAVGKAISGFRACQPISADWKAEVEADHRRRGK